MLYQVCLFLTFGAKIVALLEEGSSYWFKDADASTDNKLSVIYQTSGVSVISCAALCYRERLTSNCSAIHTVKAFTDTVKTVTCYLISEQSDSSIYQLMTLPEGTRYRLTSCIYNKNPCDPDPCDPYSVCEEIESTDCHRPNYKCRHCSTYELGERCERCIENRTGPLCQVDISNSRYVNGYYFYIPDGLRNGSEVEGMQPSCTESRTLCAKRGMRLITIDSHEKNETVATLGLHNEMCDMCVYRMSLSRQTIETPFEWDMAFGNGSNITVPVTFSNWYYGQPATMTDGYLYSAFMPSARYEWIDITCYFLAYYICEYQITEEDTLRQERN